MWPRTLGILLAASSALVAGCGSDDGSKKNTPAGAPAKATATNGLIVYGAEKEGVPTQLYTIKPDGTGATQLTHVAGSEVVNPDWSLDGTQLTYEVDSEKNAGIFVSAADGSGAHNLTPKGLQGQPSFSPDGASIVFERDPAPADNGVWIMKRDGSGLHRLTRNPFHQPDICGCDTDPNFSPDGKTITFVRIKSDDEHLAALFAMDADGGHVRRLTPFADEVAIKHAWAPDGSRIAITVGANPEPGASANIVTMRPDGTDRKRLTTFDDGRNAFVGSYSPDGTQIVLRLENGDTHSLATIPSGGGAIHRLTTGTTRPRFIDWGSAPVS
ncbi:MAG TPA: hypothetical protein VL120_12310 [Solirubrobacteraceae bacterium]|nr:hypothetical protein [Solirubrobacteraceae bacterium]